MSLRDEPLAQTLTSPDKVSVLNRSEKAPLPVEAPGQTPLRKPRTFSRSKRI